MSSTITATNTGAGAGRYTLADTPDFGAGITIVALSAESTDATVNPAFWTGGPVEGELEDWVSQASETSGSWWPYWFSWIKKQGPRMVPARKPGGKLDPLCDAPGPYVLAKA